MTKKLLLFSIVAGAFFGFISIRDEAPNTAQAPDQKSVTDQISSGDLKGEGDSRGDTLHPVSIQAFSGLVQNGSDFEVVEVLAENASYIRYLIFYQANDFRISGIMNVPKGDGPFPVLILNHGYIDPAIYTNGRGLKREQDYLAKEGYVVIHPDYRNHAYSDKDPDHHLTLRLGYSEDVFHLISAIKKSQLPYFDIDHIGMLGHSMGGGITQNILVAHPELIQAAVLFAPVSADYRDNFDKWTRQRQEQAEEILSLYGDFDENPEFWANISPINFLDQIQAPILLHHGTLDDSTPIEWSDKLADELHTSGREFIYHTYEGEYHEFIDEWPLVMKRTTDFFHKYLQ